MSMAADRIELEYLPFFVTAPGDSDLLFGATGLFLVLVTLGFGALYFTIQAIPDRLADGASKVQLQLVGLLGLLSLFTMNNAFWVAALLLAAIRIPDLVTPLRDIVGALRSRPVPAEINETRPRPEEQTSEVVASTVLPAEEGSDND